jgi:hypothetical protein
MTFLKCPACEDEVIYAQQRAFVSQEIRLLQDGSLDYEPWTSDDVDFTDKEWYVCRSCGEHSESVDHFKCEEVHHDL